MDDKIDAILSSIEELKRLYIDIQNSLVYIANKIEPNDELLPKVCCVPEDVEWKELTKSLIKKIVNSVASPYTKDSEVLASLLGELNRVYGFVLEQATKEYRDKYGTARAKPSLLDILSADAMWKDIALCIIKDLANKYDNTPMDMGATIQSIIKPLGEKYGDLSKGYSQTFHIVYKNMNCAWNNLSTRYMKQNNTNKQPRKFEIIATNPLAFSKFKRTVKALLEK